MVEAYETEEQRERRESKILTLQDAYEREWDLCQCFRDTFEYETVRSNRIVLFELDRLCHARTSTYVPGDPRASDILLGRREVWLAIQQRLFMGKTELYESLADKIERTQLRIAR